MRKTNNRSYYFTQNEKDFEVYLTKITCNSPRYTSNNFLKIFLTIVYKNNKKTHDIVLLAVCSSLEYSR